MYEFTIVATDKDPVNPRSGTATVQVYYTCIYNTSTGHGNRMTARTEHLFFLSNKALLFCCTVHATIDY